MKLVILRYNENYPDLIAVIKNNSFGDQIIVLEHESDKGVKTILTTLVNPEGNHWDESKIRSQFEMVG